jgi:hypothetical protein
MITRTSSEQLEDGRKSCTDILRDLGIGEQVSFPAYQCASIKSMCSIYSFQWDRKYSTSLRRKERMIVVTRVY